LGTLEVLKLMYYCIICGNYISVALSSP
jgi:hypothetical protein